MIILALDQATTTGFSVVTDAGAVLASGVWRLADKKRTGESRGMRYVRFRKYLTDALDREYLGEKISIICHEQTLLRGGAATEIANGLKARILQSAAERGLDVTCVHTTELKKWATGSGKAEKPDMVKAANLLSGRAPADDNEADAILIGLWASSIYGVFPAPIWASKKKAPKRKRASGQSKNPGSFGSGPIDPFGIL